MAKSCDFKTTEASTKAWFRKREFIDKNLNIQEGMLSAFREQNTYWSKQAFKRFHAAGIEPGDRLFYEEQGGKKAVPNKEMFYRIDAHEGKLYKENMKYLSEISTRIPVQTVISSKDRIIWGHPTIGKTTAKEQKGFLDFDTDFKPLVAQKLGLPESQQNSLGLNQWRKATGNEEAFNSAMREVWKLAKAEAKSKNKVLMVSDMIFLRENQSDFDKIINIPSDVFVRRAAQRGDDITSLQNWKNKIDQTLKNVNPQKIVTTDKFLSELFTTNELSDEFVDDLYNLNLTPDVIKYLYNVSSTNFSMTDYGFMLNRLVTNLKSQGKTFSEVLTDIKCL